MPANSRRDSAGRRSEFLESGASVRIVIREPGYERLREFKEPTFEEAWLKASTFLAEWRNIRQAAFGGKGVG